MDVQKDVSIASLFAKGNLRSASESSILCAFVETWWIRPIRQKPDFMAILHQLSYVEFDDQAEILKENDRVQHYFYLLEGVINCYKRKQDAEDHGQFIKQLDGPQPIGETIFSHQSTRSLTYRAMGKVKCCCIPVDIVRNLVQTILNDNQDFELLMADYLGLPLQAVGKLELYRYVTYRVFNLRDRVVTADDRRTSKNLIYLILEGECRMLEPTTKEQSIGRYNSVKKMNETALLTLCKLDIIGVEILFENKYHFSCVATTEHLKVFQIQAADYDNFPSEFKEKMQQTYKFRCRIGKKAKEAQRPRKLNLDLSRSFFDSRHYEPTKKEIKELKAICMHIPQRQSQPTSKRDMHSITMPYSGFIPKKKEPQKTNVLMKRKEWMAYLKLPQLFGNQALRF